jgi:copper chaperone CopZ
MSAENIQYPELRSVKMEVKEATIKISGMMCNGCEETVAKAIQSVDGVKEVSVSHQEGAATVSYDAVQTDLLFINMAINNTHYKVVE